MGALNPQVTVLVVIVAAGAAVLIGYATTRYFVGRVPTQDTNLAGSEFNQAQYMREVRLRNTEMLAGSWGYQPRDLAAVRGVSFADSSV